MTLSDFINLHSFISLRKPKLLPGEKSERVKVNSGIITETAAMY